MPVDDIRCRGDVMNAANALTGGQAGAVGVNLLIRPLRHAHYTGLKAGDHLFGEGLQLVLALFPVIDIGVADDAHGLAGKAFGDDGVGAAMLR